MKIVPFSKARFPGIKKYQLLRGDHDDYAFFLYLCIIDLETIVKGSHRLRNVSNARDLAASYSSTEETQLILRVR